MTNEAILNYATFTAGAVMALSGAWLIGLVLAAIAFANLAVKP